MAHNEQLLSQLTLLTGLHDRDSLTEEPCAWKARKHGFEAERKGRPFRLGYRLLVILVFSLPYHMELLFRLLFPPSWPPLEIDTVPFDQPSIPR